MNSRNGGKGCQSVSKIEGKLPEFHSMLRVSRHLSAVGLVLSLFAPAATLTQAVGDRPGDRCRTVAVDPDTNLYLYPRPVVPEPTSADTAEDTAIAPVFSREQIHLVRANVPGVDGDDRHRQSRLYFHLRPRHRSLNAPLLSELERDRGAIPANPSRQTARKLRCGKPFFGTGRIRCVFN